MTLFRIFPLTLLLTTSLIMGAFTASAQDDIPMPPSIKPPTSTSTFPQEPPPTLPELENDSRNIPEPEVRIIRKKEMMIEEYRLNGRLRYIKITPKSGAPYYMVDTDGDGILETRENDLDNPPISRWILFEW